MNMSVAPSPPRLPAPPHYMHAAEKRQVREMSGPVGRPSNDHRSAEAIIERSAVTKLFLQGRDHYAIGDELKMQVGDWTEANPNPRARADAAFYLDQVLRFIDNVGDRTLNESDGRKGHIDGFYNYGYGAVDHSEASLLKAFSQKGYEVLRNLPA